MKVKLIQSNNLQSLERTINDFLSNVKLENIDIKIIDKNFLAVITYYEKI
jgi:citrate lyase gamma subunit